MELDFIYLGKLTENGYTKSFNGLLRDECVNLNWFRSLDDACTKIEAWRVNYNEFRPNQSLSRMSLSESIIGIGANC